MRNFVQLCLEGYYDGSPFHRVIKDFMAQTGDPTGTGTGGRACVCTCGGGCLGGCVCRAPRNIPSLRTHTQTHTYTHTHIHTRTTHAHTHTQGGESIYGGPFRDETHQRLRFSHRGLVACANQNEPHTNGSQFFVTLDKWVEGVCVCVCLCGCVCVLWGGSMHTNCSQFFVTLDKWVHMGGGGG